MKYGVNLYIQIYVYDLYILSVTCLQFLESYCLHGFQGDRCRGQMGGHIARSTAIQRNLTLISAIEGTVCVQFACVTRVEREHYIEYAPFHFLLHGGYTDKAMEHKPPEEWADHAMADTDIEYPRMIWQQLEIDTKDEFETLLREKGLKKQAEEAYEKSILSSTNHNVR